REYIPRHTTIIAMTASALEGDKEKCLAAGMDDYLSKPVRSDVLQSKLERWTKTTASTGEDFSVPSSESGNVSAIDLSQLAALREIQQPGEADFVTELIDLFLDETDSHLEALHEAVVSNNAVEMRR